MAFNINDFRASLKFGGARTNHFLVRLTNPINPETNTNFSFYCKSASLPASTLNMVEANYFGRAVKYPANRIFDNWDVSIYNDEDFKIRNTLEHWHNTINGLETNIRKLPTSETSVIKSGAEVVQFSKTGTVLRTYRFIGLWPQTVAPIDLTWDQEVIQEYGVSFAYDYWIIDETITGDAGGI